GMAGSTRQRSVGERVQSPMGAVPEARGRRRFVSLESAGRRQGCTARRCRIQKLARAPLARCSEARSVIADGYNWYEDLAVGDRFATGGIVVTESHVAAFAGLTGDFFDLHVDDQFAEELGFSGRVAHGILGLALADGLKNRAAPRMRAIASLGWNWKF